MSTCLLAALLLSSCQLVVRVAAYSLTMTPNYTRIPDYAESVSFICTADAPLTSCQMTWLDEDLKAGPLLELSRGSDSQANSSHLDSGLTGYNYSGRGLEAGDCGVSLQVEGEKHWMVGCRVRGETGGWTYAWGDLLALEGFHLPNTLTSPRETVVLPGEAAEFILKAEEALSQCYFYPPKLTIHFHDGRQSSPWTDRYGFLGRGLYNGECGLRLNNVTEAENGPVKTYIQNRPWSKYDRRWTALIVARPPGAPTLSVVYTDAGATATCVVNEGRPVANISWVLGDDVVRQDSQEDSPGDAEDEWRWPWMQGSLLQRLTLNLKAEDNRKVLKCVASHVALAQALEATEIISFTAPVSTGEASTTVSSPGTGHDASPGATCTASSMRVLLCREIRGGESQPCPRDEVYEFCIREARAVASTAELLEEQAKVTLEAAKSSAKAEEARARAEEARAVASTAELLEEQAKVTLEAAKSSAKAEEARARAEEARAKNAEEELEFGRERRSHGLQPPRVHKVEAAVSSV